MSVQQSELPKQIKQVLPLLRMVYGKSWFKKVDPARLQMRSPSCCILGQLNAGKPAPFATGLDTLEHAGRSIMRSTYGVFSGFEADWKALLIRLRKEERKRSKDIR